MGLVAAGAAGGAWWLSRPPPPPPPAEAEQKYEDIDREKYEEWMQELGYTE